MGWTVRKALTRTGLAALGVLLAKVIMEIVRREPDGSISNIIWPNIGLIGLIWIGAAMFVWIVTKFIPNKGPLR